MTAVYGTCGWQVCWQTASISTGYSGHHRGTRKLIARARQSYCQGAADRTQAWSDDRIPDVVSVLLRSVLAVSIRGAFISIGLRDRLHGDIDDNRGCTRLEVDKGLDAVRRILRVKHGDRASGRR